MRLRARSPLPVKPLSMWRMFVPPVLGGGVNGDDSGAGIVARMEANTVDTPGLMTPHLADSARLFANNVDR